MLGMKTLILAFLSLALFAGCTTGKALGEKEEFWYNDQITFLGAFTWSDVYYCKNNKDQSGVVKPKCYKAIMASPQPQ